MSNVCCRLTPQTLLRTGLVLVYLVLYPHDLTTVLAPVESLFAVATRLMGITTSISPWLYVFASIGVVSWTAVGITDRIVGKDRDGA